MSVSLDTSNSIVVPLRKTSDLSRVGAVAHRFSQLLDRSIEVISIVHPGDDYAHETQRFTAAIERFSNEIEQFVALQVVVHANPRAALLELCADRLVCMATSGSPFERDHYVGSHAATLLAASRAPVILVGPATTDAPERYDDVVVATTPSVGSEQARIAGRILADALGSSIAKIHVDERGVIYESDYDESSSGLPREVHASMVRGEIDDQQLCEILVERSEHAILVLTTRANRGLAWICDGSVAFDAVRRARGPVVALGPNAMLDTSRRSSGPPTNTEPANAT